MAQSKKTTHASGHTRRIKRLERQARGAKADAKGLRYEQTVANHFTRLGWKNLEFRKRKYGYEYDILGKREETLTEPPEYLVVECKGQGRVSAKDVVRFIKKVDVFYKHLPEIGILFITKPPIYAYICYSGERDEEAADVAKAHKPSIKFKKL